MSMNNTLTFGDLGFRVYNDSETEVEPDKTRTPIRLINLDGTLVNAVLANEDDYARLESEMLLEYAKEREALLAERIRIRDEMQLLFPLPYEPARFTVSEVDTKLRELEQMFSQVEHGLDEIETGEQIAMRPKLPFLVNGMFLRYC
jgi:hypothetical protein